MLAPRQSATLPFIRTLHSAGFAVLERSIDQATVALAASGEFELVAWFATGSAAEATAFRRVHAAGQPLVVLFEDATAALVADALVNGADACLQVDADARVVVAQLHAVLRRHRPTGAAERNGILEVGDLRLDLDRCELERAGQPVSLTASEFRILEYMARNAGRVLKPHEVLNAVTGEYEYTAREAQEVFKVYVRRIRRKLEPSFEEPQYLVTARGFGYRLEGAPRLAGQRAVATA
ncbi:MAG: winged helix-turn-helix domain-containing protein [Dehalococcoidia bacterium]